MASSFEYKYRFEFLVFILFCSSHHHHLNSIQSLSKQRTYYTQTQLKHNLIYSTMSAARITSALTKNAFKTNNTVGRVAGNLAGWGVVFSIFMAWPLFVQTYQYQINCRKLR